MPFGYIAGGLALLGVCVRILWRLHSAKGFTTIARLFHICAHEAWGDAQRRGDYRADSLETEGFIHCSTPEQVAGTANLLFRGQQGLVLLSVDSDRVTAPIKYELASNGLTFPHIYGPLNLDAVVGVRDFAPGADGEFEQSDSPLDKA